MVLSIMHSDVVGEDTVLQNDPKTLGYWFV